MERAFAASHQTHFSAPGRGRTLGWRLAISTVLITSVVMGSISFGQQFLQLKEQETRRQELLAMSLAPLALNLEAAPSLEMMRSEIEEFHTAYLKRGYAVHQVILRDAADKRALFVAPSDDHEQRGGHLKAVIPIASPLLEGGTGSLSVSVNSEVNRNATRRGWWLWAIHFAATLGVLVLFLATAIYFQVTKPVSRLVQSVKKMEKGYWQPTNLASGAWEIRWLAWRFGNMAQEVQTTMTHFLEAESKARTLTLERMDGRATEEAESQSGSDNSHSDHTDSPAYDKLLAVCERLEATSPDEPGAAALGRKVWKQEAAEANRLGLFNIKARLEDAALRLTEPEAFKRLDDQLFALTGPRQEWMEQCRDAMYLLLEQTEIPCLGVLHRVKHTASVWGKMRSKELRLEEVPDLFAFRIIVPTEADCYAALSVMHQRYKPVISRFKDYITKPKENGYQSLHTCVTENGGPVFELQIRSIAMDRQAMHGDAAHWVYKRDGDEADKLTEMRWWQKFLR